MRSQLLPPSAVCSRIDGFPTIQPSSPLKLIDWNLQQGVNDKIITRRKQ
jgi:hypothetical protein